MNKVAVTLALVFALVTPAFAADLLEGVWKTKPDDNGEYGYVRIGPCGEKLCGVLVQAFDSSGKGLQSRNIGKKIIWGMEPQGDGAYGEGKIWAPDRGKTYKSKLELSGNELAVSGCVFGICRDGGTWTRVK